MLDQENMADDAFLPASRESGFEEIDRFSTNDELKYKTKDWLKEHSQVSYFTGIQKLQQRYKLCLVS